MNAPTRKGDWMQTLSGVQFWPLDPKPDEIHIGDIAGALSKMCRYSGHCLRFYSVAEHCVLAAQKAPDHLKLTTLLHDASEAYLVDIPRPIKPYLANYIQLESRLMEVISQRFDTMWPLPTAVKDIDNAMLVDERDQNMAPPPAEWAVPSKGAGVALQFWNPRRAAEEFLDAFYTYGGVA